MAPVLRPMATLSEHNQARIRQFSRQPDGEEVVIGNSSHRFLALPKEAIEVLDLLATGNSMATTRSLYAAKHGELPDIEGLLEALTSKGFLANEAGERPEVDATNSPAIKYHFEKLPESLAKKIFGRTSLSAAALICLAALTAIVLEPSLLPSRRTLEFQHNVTLMLVYIMLLSFATTFVHELAHLVAARSRGVPCRLGIGNRLWILVAETDMTGIWTLPPKKRYLPILAGPLIDLVSVSVLTIVLFANLREWVHLSSTTTQLVRAATMIYLLRLIWQFFFFVRTDLYFVFTTYYRCKNLLEDTQVFLKNNMSLLWTRLKAIPQDHIPPKEMAAIRIYSLFWLLGRAVALSVLIFVTLPVMVHYFSQTFSILVQTPRADPSKTLDFAAITLISLLFGLSGFGLWAKELLGNRRRN